MKTKAEVFVNYLKETWRAEIGELEYDGTFSINHCTNAVHIEWYQIPEDVEIWEDVEAEVRSIVAVH